MKIVCYTDTEYKNNLMSDFNQVVHKTGMNIDCIESGTFVVDTKTGAFGVFDKTGKFVDSSLQYRGKNHQFIPKFTNCVEYMNCDAIFMGNAYPHFGHFLIEHLNRAWGVSGENTENLKYVFVDNKNIGAKKWLFDFMNMLGVKKEDVIILNKSMRFENVFIPTQSFNNSGLWWADEFVVPFGKMRENVSIGQIYDKVYVSRAKLSDDMRVYGEEKIQNIFAKNGFHIIYPETLSVSEQVAIIGNANVLAGCAGTALHMSLFMKPGGRVVQLNRSTDVRDSGVLQARMCQMCGLDFDVVAASVETFKSKHGGMHAPQIIGCTKYLKQWFDDNAFVYSDDDLTMDADAVGQYQQQLDVYRKLHGNNISAKLKKFVIKFVACLVPGRIWRGRVRKYLKEHL